MFSGHTDVVPVDDQDWSSDPFAPDVRDGSLYGRGTCDMKSFIGIVVAAIPDIVARPLAKPIHFAFSYDEEVGCIGAAGLVEEVVSRNLCPDVCVVGEPSEMRVIRAHKSMNVIRVDLHGVSAHSSLTPQGVNAIEYGAELIRFVRSAADELRASGPVRRRIRRGLDDVFGQSRIRRDRSEHCPRGLLHHFRIQEHQLSWRRRFARTLCRRGESDRKPDAGRKTRQPP